MHNPLSTTAPLGKIFNRTAWRTIGFRQSYPGRTVDWRNGPTSDGSSICVVEGPAFIEPDFGYVIRGGRGLIEDSMTPNFEHDTPPWKLAMPSPLDFRRRRRSSGAHLVHFDAVVSLRHWWEWNYYHFYFDVLSKLQLFDDAGVPPDTPIVLGRYVSQLPFTRQILETGSLRERKWVIPDVENNTIVASDKIYYCRTRRPFASRASFICQTMGTPAAQSETGIDRIYLTRSENASRRATNEADLLPVLAQYGFRMIDAGSLSIEEQMQTFSAARYVVALHGAGVTNVIFRSGAPLGVLELHSRTYPGPGDMTRICDGLGFFHDQLAGDPTDNQDPQHADFQISPDSLRAAIERLLANG
jgi:capsular polysaccharide biosynthesis protein